MNADSIARIAGLIGEAGRIQMLTTLLDGQGHPAAELAMAASVSPQTASSHLAKLLDGELISSERRGRQRFFRLKNSDVATAIEALGALAEDSGTDAMPELRFARTCYDHLAGVLAIALRNELLGKGVMRQGKDTFLVTSDGERFLRRFEIDTSALRKARRAFAYKCLDWTERHHHIGGSVGAALLARFMEMKWLARMRGTRTVRLTHAGERGFEEIFGVRHEALRSLSPARASLPKVPVK
ncbi:MAG: helix-turn-helix transcriptional regulator [Candidatus Sulfotelmatobacter sp.]